MRISPPATQPCHIDGRTRRSSSRMLRRGLATKNCEFCRTSSRRLNDDLMPFVASSQGNQTQSAERPPATSYVHKSQAMKPEGWAKVLGCCKIAEQFGIQYVWIDTCCIDKNSSTELSESLNTMFAWYQCSTLCIAYLSDVPLVRPKVIRPFERQISAWFSRGWTLQELIAPKDIWFYSQDWTFLGIRSELVEDIHRITGIQEKILRKNGIEELHSIGVAAKMSCKSCDFWGKCCL